MQADDADADEDDEVGLLCCLFFCPPVVYFVVKFQISAGNRFIRSILYLFCFVSLKVEFTNTVIVVFRNFISILFEKIQKH